MKKLLGVMDWYDGLSDGVRMKYQNIFGKYDIPDRESRFFEWLSRVREIRDTPPEDTTSPEKTFEQYFDSLPELEISMVAENGGIWMHYSDGRPSKLFANRIFDPFDGKYKYVKIQ